MLILPDRFFYANRLTTSARRLLLRLGVGLAGAVVLGAAVGLLDRGNWMDVLAGAGFAWSVSLVIWAVASYRRGRDETQIDLRRVAEIDLLHHRLNQAAPKLGIPRLDLEAQIEDVLAARMERLAHYAGLDEFRVNPSSSGYDFWAH